MISALDSDPESAFPPLEHALREPDGLLAVGGDLHPRRLLRAYAQGIFPWYSEGQPILWWSPDPRMVIAPQDLRVSRSLRKQLLRSPWRVTFNARCGEVIAHCAELPRPGQGGTWITQAMRAAYLQLHADGWVHSIEVQHDDELVGGIYGVGIGRMFFGESMFSRRSGGSKVAILALCRALRQLDVMLLDGQVHSEHLASLGFSGIPRDRFAGYCQRLAAVMNRLDFKVLDPASLQPRALANRMDP
jgi:leucyl/phenylalanyl-tRNA--protein transferase